MFDPHPTNRPTVVEGVRVPEVPPSYQQGDHWHALALLRASRTSARGPRIADKVYFMRCEGFVKIGIAADVQARLAAFRLHCPFPIKLTAVVVGGRATERELHARFAAYHERGDWFRVEGELANYLATLEAAQ